MKHKGFLGMCLTLLVSACVAMPAMAGPYSRSYSSPKRTVTVNKTYHRTTVVQQSAPASSSGGGFFSSFLGGAAGASVTNYLMNDDKPAEAPAQVPAPVAPAAPACDARLYDCTPRTHQ